MTRTTTAYALAGTDTFRLGSKTLFRFKGQKWTGYGGNLQNWNKYNRDIVIPDEGKTLIQIDQAGAEAKIVAYLCRPGRYRQLFEYGIKPHTYLAMHLFAEMWAAEMGFADWKIEDYLTAPINKLKEMTYWRDFDIVIKGSGLRYDTGKMVCHAANYNMKAPTFQLNAMLKSEGQLLLSIKECNRLLYTYHNLFPEIRQWHEDVKSELNRLGELRNLFGHPRRFLDFFGESRDKKGFAFIPQSTVGTITNIALTEIQERIENEEKLEAVDILQNGHDSGLFQAPSALALEVAKTLKPHFERSFSHNGFSFSMGAEVAIGQNWRPWSVENPEGMKEIKI